MRFVFWVCFTLDSWKDNSAESGGRRKTFLNLKDENREKVTVKKETTTIEGLEGFWRYSAAERSLVRI